MPDQITVAEAMGDEPIDKTVKRVTPPRHPTHPPFPEPGIYFGMPDDVYHAIHACSASGLKNLSVTSMDYWALSVLNQEREEISSGNSGALTGKQLGQAYHSFIVEGVLAFNERFAVALDKDVARTNAVGKGQPFCVTVADIRVAIDAAGAKPKGTSKDALADQLLDLVPDAVIWDREVAAHEAANAGKTMISSKLFRRIAIADAMIKNDPQLKDAFTGGHAEVSIFWYCPMTGAPMKARLDYIKLSYLIDLKSFSNMQNKPIQRAIDMAISNNKYFIPVVVYSEAIEMAKQMIRNSNGGHVYQYNAPDGCVDPKLVDWCWKWAHQPEPEVIFIFQQTGIAPVTRGRKMERGTTYMVTKSAVEFLKKKWVRCAEAYDVDPWVDFEPVTRTVDESLTWAATDFGDVP